MKRNFFHKSLSSFLIISLLLSITFRVPLEQFLQFRAFAQDNSYYELIAVVVDEESYDEADIRSKILRYAEDIETARPQTRAVIIPTPRDASVFEIASLHEKLYFEGYEAFENVDFTTRLVGTVLVGDIPIPFVFDGNNFAQNLLPYTDFIDKSYIYNHITGRYEKTKLPGNSLTPEIWHGVIQPNLGSQEANKQALRDYFDKNHDYYQGQGVFETGKLMVNGTQDAVDPNYKPFVFYYDQFRESAAWQNDRYVGYQAGRDNIEDLRYNRYTKEIADEITKQVMGTQNDEIKNLLGKVDPGFDTSAFDEAGQETDRAPEIITQNITNQAINSFIEIYNSGTFSDLRKNVYNAGRYNTGGAGVNVDFIPYLITVLDEVSDGIIETVNFTVQDEIMFMVENGLSRDIAVLREEIYYGNEAEYQISPPANRRPLECPQTNTHFYYGTKAANISQANQCNILRGGPGGKIVEANKMFNMQSIQGDVDICGGAMKKTDGAGRVVSGIMGYWGGNSAVNNALKSEGNKVYDPGLRKKHGAIEPLFDLLGSYETEDQETTLSPLDCFKRVGLIPTYKKGALNVGGNEQSCALVIDLPHLPKELCDYEHEILPVLLLDDIQDELVEEVPAGQCAASAVFIGDKKFYLLGPPKCGDSLNQCCPIEHELHFQIITSPIVHASPDSDEYLEIANNLTVPSVPVDKDRYVDFIGAVGGRAPDFGYQRIDFPEMFRIDAADPLNVSPEEIAKLTKEELDKITAQINNIIEVADPGGLEGIEKIIYEILQTGPYPRQDIDLYGSLTKRPPEYLTVGTQVKEISYFDNLVFAQYWKNLKHPSEKYRYIFENYLSSQFAGKHENPFVLPEHKNSYEIGYFIAPGDAQNMHIKVDPEHKRDHPYAETISQNAQLQAELATNFSTEIEFNQRVFECSPPDGVMLWEWFPAIECWLEDMLPPKIYIGANNQCGKNEVFGATQMRGWGTSGGAAPFLAPHASPIVNYEAQGPSPLSSTQTNQARQQSVSQVHDCTPEKLNATRLILGSDSARYSLADSGVLYASLLDEEGKKVPLTSNSYVEFYIERLALVDENSQETQIIYDSNTQEFSSSVNLDAAKAYLQLPTTRIPLSAGESQLRFQTGNFDANIKIGARFTGIDANGGFVDTRVSEPIDIDIRKNLPSLSLFSFSKNGALSTQAFAYASSTPQLYISESSEAIETFFTNNQNNENTLVLGILENTASANNLRYPVQIAIQNTLTGEEVFSGQFQKRDLSSVLELAQISQAGRYEIYLRDSSGLSATRSFDIFPQEASRIDVFTGTNIKESTYIPSSQRRTNIINRFLERDEISLNKSAGNISTHVIGIYDMFENIVSGEPYTIEARINGDGLVFDDTNTNYREFTTTRGFQAFRLRSTPTAGDNQIIFQLKDAQGKYINEVSRSIKTIERIEAQIRDSDFQPIVGGGVYTYELSFHESQGNILGDLNSRVLLSVPNHYGVATDTSFPIVGGKASIAFQTGKIAGKDIPLHFQIEGGNTRYTHYVDIDPQDAIRVDVHLSKTAIEADGEDFTVLEAVLKDRFDNVVVTDGETQIQLEVHERSIIAYPEATQKTVQQGKTNFRIYAGEIPGTVHVKVKTFPDLGDNTFISYGLSPISKDKVQIPGMINQQGELTNLGKRFFREQGTNELISIFPTKELLEASEVFQSIPELLQTQLLDVWDLKSIRPIQAIGETALSFETFYFWNKKAIDDNAYNTLHTYLMGSNYGDVSQEDYLAGSMLFDRNNSALSVTSYLNTPFNFHDIFYTNSRGTMAGLGGDDISQDIDFQVGLNKNGHFQITLINSALETFIANLYYITQNPEFLSYDTYRDDYSLQTLPSGETNFRDPQGNILFEFHPESAFSLRGDTTLEFDQNYTGEGVKILLYDKEILFGEVHLEGDFSSDISRNISLISQKQNVLQDTILVELLSNQYSQRTLYNDDKVYSVFYFHDMFAVRDQLDSFHKHDIPGGEQAERHEGLGWKDENTMILSFAGGMSVGESSKNYTSFSLINLGDPVLSLKDIPYTFIGSDAKKSFNPTLGKIVADDRDIENFELLDFNNDQKKDFITIHTDGRVKLYEKVDTPGEYIFHRDIVYASDSGSPRFILPGDFTGDGYDDIFFVNNSGLPYLYNNHKKQFTRTSLVGQLQMEGANIIQAKVFDMDADGKDDIVTLNSQGDIHIWYGGGTAQVPEFTKNFLGSGYNLTLQNTPVSSGGALYFEGLLQDVQNSAIDISSLESTENIMNEDIINGLLFSQLRFTPSAGDTNEDTLQKEVLFIKSAYAEYTGVQIEKTFTDTSPEIFQAGDTVFMDITFKNTTENIIQDIAYVDTIPQPFRRTSKNILREDGVLHQEQTQNIAGYQIFFDDFVLGPNQTRIFRVELEVLPLEYGHIEVGIFEQGEIGYDIYGDVIIKEKEENCGQEVEMFQSLSNRTYAKVTSAPVCDNDALNVGNTFPNLADTNQSGTPDMIENLLGQIESGNAVEALAPLQDQYDELLQEENNKNKQNDHLSGKSMIDTINALTDEGLEELDNLIEGLSCGFGGGTCTNMPLNWAPLAPGSVPSLLGVPLGKLEPSTGIPIFSAFTGIMVPPVPICLPTYHRDSQLGFLPLAPCDPQFQAGGYLGTESFFNILRLYVTPTLTGGIGVAVCFGGSAELVGNLPGVGLHPLVPAGNCVVYAKPLLGCSGEDGDPASLGQPMYAPQAPAAAPGAAAPGFGGQAGQSIAPQIATLYANCPPTGSKKENKEKKESPLSGAFVQDYLQYQSTGQAPQTLQSHYTQTAQTLQESGYSVHDMNGEPIIQIGSGENGAFELDVGVDLSALKSGGTFQDIIVVENKRSIAFPDFFMTWVEDQLDEITSKLTNLPNIYIILPDFSGIFDYSYKDIGKSLQENFEKGAEENQKARDSLQSNITSLRQQKSSLDCNGEDELSCRFIDFEIARLQAQTSFQSPKEVMSGVRQVYEFLGKIPLINVESEEVVINIPHIDKAELDRTLTDWRLSAVQYRQEIDRAIEQWSLGYACNQSSEVLRKKCEEDNAAMKKFVVDGEAFLASLNHNIAVLESYADIPMQVGKLFRSHEIFLESLLCNIESLSELMGEWIHRNGLRFKSWVEAFTLIKAALQSWQLLLDVFIDYETSCHECKNERYDFFDFLWKLVSVVIPELPVIEFPKWPDIVIDLHHIRIGATIKVPEFTVQYRPIVLPALPELILPDVPSANIILPELPLLQELYIPDLDFSFSLPTVDLPDLPPPPKIPKLFGIVQIVLNIGKLVTKIMCIIKGSPFVPEWRAGDQISYITEREGYLEAIDFLHLKTPTFSYSAVSEIRATSYVDFHEDTDFLIEIAQAVTLPVNGLTNNIINYYDFKISNIFDGVNTDFSDAAPRDFEKDLGNTPSRENLTHFLAYGMAKAISETLAYVSESSHISYNNTDFTNYMLTQVMSPEFSKEAGTRKIQQLWVDVAEYDFQKEDALIQELQDYNTEKFTLLQEIIKSEISHTQKRIEEIENTSDIDEFIQVFQDEDVRFDVYKEQLNTFNLQSLDSAIALVSGVDEKQQAFQDELQKEGEDFMHRVRNDLFASTDTPEIGGTGQSLSCAPTGGIEFQYEGMYIMEQGKNYRLFDYVDLLVGDEKMQSHDIDLDGDNDILYIMNGKIYLKNNTHNKKVRPDTTYRPLVLEPQDHSFFEENIFLEAVNNFSETSTSQGAMNVGFLKPSDPSVLNFRLTYYDRLDAFLRENESMDIYSKNKHIVDAIASRSQALTIREKTPDYTLKNHLAYISHAGIIPGLTYTTKKLHNIRENIENNIQVTLTKGSALYAGNNSARIFYIQDGEEKQITLPRRSSIAFENTIQIQSIIGDAFVEQNEQGVYRDSEIVNMVGMPVLPGSIISFEGNTNTLSQSSNIQIRYYDNSQALIDFREVQSYTFHNLGNPSGDSYKIRLETPNTFFYAHIQAFREDTFGTKSYQGLLAPQQYADITAPTLQSFKKIRTPLYQTSIIDITPFIDDDSGIEAIDIIRLDLNESELIPSQSGSDHPNIQVEHSPSRIALRVGPFSSAISTKAVLRLVDKNGNISTQEIDFEAYAPSLDISSIQEDGLTGNIEENIDNIPVYVYRFRGGSLERLRQNNGSPMTLSFSGGVFQYDIQKTDTPLVELRHNNNVIAQISEETGSISLGDPRAEIFVYASNENNTTSPYPEIHISYEGESVFEQFMIPPGESLKIISKTSMPEERGYYIQLLNEEQYEVYQIPDDTPYNPGAIVVYGQASNTQNPVLTALQNGIVNIDSGNFILRYENHNSLPSFVLYDTQTNSQIVRIVYNLQSQYIIQ